MAAEVDLVAAIPEQPPNFNCYIKSAHWKELHDFLVLVKIEVAHVCHARSRLHPPLGQFLGLGGLVSGEEEFQWPLELGHASCHRLKFLLILNKIDN